MACLIRLGDVHAASCWIRGRLRPMKADQTAACWGNNMDSIGPPPPYPFLQVSLGTMDACGLRTDSSVFCWGLDFGPALTPTLTPTRTPTMTATPTLNPAYVVGGIANSRTT